MQDLWSGAYKEPAVWADVAEALISSADLQSGMRILDLGSANGETLFRVLARVGTSGSVVGTRLRASIGSDTLQLKT